MTVPAHLAAELPQALKVWQTEGKHRFYCNGRIMVGPDIGVSIFAATLTTGSCMLFWVFVCAQLSPRLHLAVTVGGVVLYLISLVFMVLTATTDPGILPRNPFMEDSEAGQRAQEMHSKMHSIAVCKEDAVSLMSKKGAGGESVATESQLGESQADD